MIEKINYGMVGGAHDAFIGDVHRKAIAFDPRAHLAAGCFSSAPKRNADTGVACNVDPARVYATYQDMAKAESERPDGIRFVSITTPNNTHYPIAKCFLQHGIHVMCEKPLCFTVQEADDLAALAKQKGLLFGVTYTYAGYNMVKVMREMIAAGKIGEVVAVNAEYPQEWLIDELGESDPGTAKFSGWRSDPKVAGISNCVGDIGTHI
ncbi:MAG: Gfo/Idh/MocA family oxidoreductase, partial [Clostridia bacterium]|nr:Gfo/Idh/MocA family oxidoreductase [Clostridia bacterium]